jgi:hypothetical protein
VGYIENHKEKDENETASPRKRRAATSAIASVFLTPPDELDGPIVAARGKRKEVDDEDSPIATPPPPPKRPRNRNGASSSTLVHSHVRTASPSPSVHLRAQEDDMAVDKTEDLPLNTGSTKTNGRAKRGSRATGGGTRRNGGRRGARREKEIDKDKDSSLDDDDSLVSMPAVQVVTIPADVVTHENALSVAINEEQEIKPLK